MHLVRLFHYMITNAGKTNNPLKSTISDEVWKTGQESSIRHPTLNVLGMCIPRDYETSNFKVNPGSRKTK